METHVKKPPNFTSLPNEIIFHIFEYLDAVSRIRLRRVCRKWNSFLRETVSCIKLDERWFNSYVWKRFCMHVERRRHGAALGQAAIFFENLRRANLFNGVKSVIIEGDYDLTDDKPHPDDRFAGFDLSLVLVLKIRDFRMLDSIVLHEVPLDLEYLLVLTKHDVICRVVVSESTVFIDYRFLDERLRLSFLRVGFPVDKCKVFDLSGKSARLQKVPDLHILDKMHHDFYGHYWMDRVIAEFILEQCNAVKDEEVSRLGDLYSTLLRGGPGVVIRSEILRLFGRLFSKRGEYDGLRKHWEHCKEYDFKSLDKITKYVLVHFANPRNCHRLADQPDPDEIRFGELKESYEL